MDAKWVTYQFNIAGKQEFSLLYIDGSLFYDETRLALFFNLPVPSVHKKIYDEILADPAELKKHSLLVQMGPEDRKGIRFFDKKVMEAFLSSYKYSEYYKALLDKKAYKTRTQKASLMTPGQQILKDGKYKNIAGFQIDDTAPCMGAGLSKEELDAQQPPAVQIRKYMSFSDYFFRFSGTVSRLEFLGCMVGLGIVGYYLGKYVVSGTLLLFILDSWKNIPFEFAVKFALVMIGSLILNWAECAVITKRLRDIGVNHRVVLSILVLAYFLFNVIGLPFKFLIWLVLAILPTDCFTKLRNIELL